MEYALFDLISVSNATNYGGCIVIDNIENRPTRLALKSFLSLFPWWTCLIDGELVDACSLNGKAESISSHQGYSWAVLIAPQDNTVSPAGRVLKLKISDKNPTQVQINFANTNREKHAACEIRKLYFPFNVHITGVRLALEEKHLIEIFLDTQETSKQVDLVKRPQGKVGEGFWLIEAELYPKGDNHEAFIILDRDIPIKA